MSLLQHSPVIRLTVYPQISFVSSKQSRVDLTSLCAEQKSTNFCSQINCDTMIIAWSLDPAYHSFSASRYCLFGVNSSNMLGSEIEVCNPPRNDLESCQCHRNADPFVWRSVLDCPYKTK